MGGVLVHADGARHHAAPHVRDARDLERTLDRAVLPALAVQDGQGNVNEKWTYATLEHLDEAARGQERDGRAVVRVPRPRSELCGVTRVVQPAALSRDANEHQLKAVAKRRDHVVGRFEGYVVLGGDATKDERHARHGTPPVVCGRPIIDCRRTSGRPRESVDARRQAGRSSPG